MGLSPSLAASCLSSFLACAVRIKITTIYSDSRGWGRGAGLGWLPRTGLPSTSPPPGPPVKSQLGCAVHWTAAAQLRQQRVCFPHSLELRCRLSPFRSKLPTKEGCRALWEELSCLGFREPWRHLLEDHGIDIPCGSTNLVSSRHTYVVCLLPSLEHQGSNRFLFFSFLFLFPSFFSSTCHSPLTFSVFPGRLTGNSLCSRQ